MIFNYELHELSRIEFCNFVANGANIRMNPQPWLQNSLANIR